MSIGIRIKAARENMNMTQEELGKIVNASKQTIYKYENGIVTNIPFDKIESIAAALGITPAYLMGWNDSENDKSNKDKQFMDLYRSLPEQDRADVERYIQFLLSKRQ